MSLKIKARDVMVDTVVTLKPNMSLEEAWGSLFENRISGAPVVDHHGNILGVLSQTDLVREAFSDRFGEFPKNSFYMGLPFSSDGSWEQLSDKLSSMTVEEVMTTDPVCVNASDDVGYLANQMRQNHIHRLIVTEGTKVVGIVSSLDMLKLLEKQ